VAYGETVADATREPVPAPPFLAPQAASRLARMVKKKTLHKIFFRQKARLVYTVGTSSFFSDLLPGDVDPLVKTLLDEKSSH
jgi:hypothetical protein